MIQLFLQVEQGIKLQAAGNIHLIMIHGQHGRYKKAHHILKLTAYPGTSRLGMATGPVLATE